MSTANSADLERQTRLRPRSLGSRTAKVTAKIHEPHGTCRHHPRLCLGHASRGPRQRLRNLILSSPEIAAPKAQEPACVRLVYAGYSEAHAIPCTTPVR